MKKKTSQNTWVLFAEIAQKIAEKPIWKELLQTNAFYLQAAQDKLQAFEEYEATATFLNTFLETFQKFKGKYLDFITSLEKNSKSYHFAIQIGQLIAHLDGNAANKQQWNTTEDQRVVGHSNIRQDLWVQNLITYKTTNKNLKKLTPIARHAIEYLTNPVKTWPILSKSHRKQISNNLLKQPFSNKNLTIKLLQLFKSMGLSFPKSSKNETYFFTQLLYHPDLKSFWQYTDQDVYQEELLKAQLAAESTPVYKRFTPTQHPLNQLLYGPPGTGKTYEGLQRAIAIIENRTLVAIQQEAQATIQQQIEEYTSKGQLVFTTFHPSLSYEDFIEGIKPEMQGKQIRYVLQDGILKQLAKKANENPDKQWVLIMDEFNRGDIARIFGELISLLEPQRRQQQLQALQIMLPYSKALFSLPPNLFLIGTMNTTDRSTEPIDNALRRRFQFIWMPPLPHLVSENMEGVNLQKLLETINQRIIYLSDISSCIGHSYFMQIGTLNELQACFQLQIIPLLEDIFLGDLGKVGLILGSGFIEKMPAAQLSDFSYKEWHGFAGKTIYKVAKFPLKKEAYIQIYEVV